MPGLLLILVALVLPPAYVAPMLATCLGPQCVDCKGFFICCGPTTNKWFVAPACTQVSRNWYCRADSAIVANSCMGSCGWFVPTLTQLQNPGSICRSYWDSYCTSVGSADYYWSDTPYNSNYAPSVSISTGNTLGPGGVPGGVNQQGRVCPVRSFRCVAS
jgi:hypothetical protein